MSSNPRMADLLIELRQDIVAFREANRLLIQGICVSLVQRGILTPTQAMARLAWLDERPTTSCGVRRDADIQAPTISASSLRSIKGGRLDS
jgi:hypothetical protein